MAKRKRLDPVPQVGALPDPGTPAPTSALPSVGAPIARVAQEAAREAAFEDMRTALLDARSEGRLIQKLPLDAIVLDHLLRDRIGLEDTAQTALVESLRARGQQVPIEVTALGKGQFGLISGWRRMAALKQLHAETGAARFATVLAILRRPETAGDAYQAMVEENEIRLGLSHFERARIVARAVEAGVFSDTRTALQKLFAHGSRARRSKIRAFLGVVAALEGVLRFPGDLGERLGLALARRLEQEAGFADQLRAALAAASPDSAEAERLVLEAALAAGRTSAPAANPVATEATPPQPLPACDSPAQGAARRAPEPAACLDPAPGVRLQISGGYLKPVLTLSGPNVDQAFKERLIAWLQTGGNL